MARVTTALHSQYRRPRILPVLISILFATFCFNVFPEPSPAATKIKVPANKTQNAKEVNDTADHAKEHHQLYWDAVGRLEAQSQRQYDRFWDFINAFKNSALWCIGIALALLSFFGFRSWKELKPWLAGYMKSLFESEGRKHIDREVEIFRENIRTLHKEVESVTAYRRKRLVWIFEKDEITAEDEIKFLYSKGFSSIQVITPPAAGNLNVQDFDLVILSFDKSEVAKAQLKDVTQKLMASPLPIGLVIYTYNEGNPVTLDKDDFETLKGFKWFVLANFPGTLIAQVSALIRNSDGTTGTLTNG